MKTSIKNQVIIGIVLVVVGMCVAQLLFNAFFATDFYVSEKSKEMLDIYEIITLGYNGDVEGVSDLIEYYELKDGMNIVVYTKDQVIYSNRKQPFDPKLGHGEENIPTVPRNYTVNDAPEVLLVDEKGNVDTSSSPFSVLRLQGGFSYGEEEIYCSITLPIVAIDSSVSTLSKSNILITVVVLILGVLYALFYAKTITKPLLDIEQVTGRLANLDFTQQVETSSSITELESLGTSINQMSHTLEDTIARLNEANIKLQADIDHHKQLVEMRKIFVANVSHEMKTPLALLRMYASNLQSDFEGINKDYYYQTIQDEAQRLSDMVSSLLDMSAVESGLSNMEMCRFNLTTRSRNLVARMLPLLEDFQLEVEIEEGIEVDGDPKYIEQAIKNFINNASQHTEQGGKIRIFLKTEEDKAVFTVWNEGDHIAEEDIPHLWDSFYRSDKARVRVNKNVGLGLYIVKTIIDKHEGSYTVANKEDGVAFSFFLGTEPKEF